MLFRSAEVKELIQRFVKTDGDNPAIILDNSDWINKEPYIDFMRNVGVYFNINRMLATDCYQKRLEEGGLTFLEMGYMLMQAYDFIYLNEKYNCTLQIGGSDQWANMVAGVELGRKIDSAEGKNHGELQALTYHRHYRGRTGRSETDSGADLARRARHARRHDLNCDIN